MKAQGKPDLAFEAYQAEVTSSKSVLKDNAQDNEAQDNLSQAAFAIAELAGDFILAHEFAQAFEAADYANSLFPGVWIEGRRAHALMFSGRTDEDRYIYLKFRGQKSGDKTWEANVLGDFHNLGEHRLSHPLMDEMGKLLGAPSEPRRGQEPQ